MVGASIALASRLTLNVLLFGFLDHHDAVESRVPHLPPPSLLFSAMFLQKLYYVGTTLFLCNIQSGIRLSTHTYLEIGVCPGVEQQLYGFYTAIQRCQVQGSYIAAGFRIQARISGVPLSICVIRTVGIGLPPVLTIEVLPI